MRGGGEEKRRGKKEEKRRKRGEGKKRDNYFTLWPWSAIFIRIKLTHICTPLLKGAGGCCALGSAGSFACILPISPGTTATTTPGSTCIVKIEKKINRR